MKINDVDEWWNLAHYAAYKGYVSSANELLHMPSLELMVWIANVDGDLTSYKKWRVSDATS